MLWPSYNILTLPQTLYIILVLQYSSTRWACIENQLRNKKWDPQAHLKRNFLLILPSFDILKIPTTLFRPRLFSSPFLWHKFDYVCKRRAALYFSHFCHIITGWVFRGQMRKKLVRQNTKGLSMLIHLNFI